MSEKNLITFNGLYSGNFQTRSISVRDKNEEKLRSSTLPKAIF